MTIVREFFSSFTKIKRTPILLLHVLPPAAVTILFLVYYAFAGYRIIADVRWFFIILQIFYPIFVSISVPVFVHLDRNVSNMQNALGVVGSRKSVYLGKLFFLLFLSAINMIIYELCFYIGVKFFLDISITQFAFYPSVFCIFLISSLFLYLLHLQVSLRFGSSISVVLGICGTISAGFFENAIGDKIWPVIPWEWGVRFLEKYFGFSAVPVFHGIISLVIITLLVLSASILWFDRWEGRVIQE